MPEMLQTLPEAGPLTREEKSAISHFAQDATSIFSRRVLTGSYLLEQVVPGIGRYLAWEARADDRHAYLAIFPKHEKSAMVERRRKFGTSFPGLYSIGGASLGADNKVGGINVPKAKGPIALYGEGRGKSGILTSCAFDIDKDAQLTICNLRVRSPKEERRRYDYRVYLLFLVTLGTEFDYFSVSAVLEDQVTRFFLENSARKAVA